MLPQEIFDAILDYLHDDHQSLASTSLVCKASLVSSRRLHYRTSSLILNIDNTSSFIELTKASPRLSFVPAVRRLTIDGRGILAVGKAAIRNHVVPVLRSMEGITHLEVRNMVWHWPGFGRFLKSFKRLETLDIWGANFTHMDDILDIICSHPSLRTLLLSRIRVEKPFSSNFSGTLPPKLERIDIDFFDNMNANFLSWMSSTESTRLQSLFISDSGVGEGDLVTQTAERIKDSLEHLHIGFANILDADTLLRLFDPTQNPGLRSISVELSISEVPQPEGNPIRCISEILDVIRFSSLSKAEFRVLGHGLSNHDWLAVEMSDHWLALDDVLESLLDQRFSATLEFASPFEELDGLATLAEVIPKKLPKCYGRGILRLASIPSGFGNNGFPHFQTLLTITRHSP